MRCTGVGQLVCSPHGPGTSRKEGSVFGQLLVATNSVPGARELTARTNRERPGHCACGESATDCARKQVSARVNLAVFVDELSFTTTVQRFAVRTRIARTESDMPKIFMRAWRLKFFGSINHS